jgi:hypothetical protein
MPIKKNHQQRAIPIKTSKASIVNKINMSSMKINSLEYTKHEVKDVYFQAPHKTI